MCIRDSIKARESGYVVLAGDYAANRGVIEARLGTVLLGSANSLTLDIVGDSLVNYTCLLYTSPSPRDRTRSRMPSSA